LSQSRHFRSIVVAGGVRISRSYLQIRQDPREEETTRDPEGWDSVPSIRATRMNAALPPDKVFDEVPDSVPLQRGKLKFPVLLRGGSGREAFMSTSDRISHKCCPDMM